MAIFGIVSRSVSFQSKKYDYISRWGVLPILLLLSGLLTVVRAETYGDFTYAVTNSSVTITKYAGPGGTVTIPDSIEGKPVTSIGYAAFQSCVTLANITIPNSVTVIGIGAFGGCTGLTNFTIPDSVTTIGDQAFYGCTSLMEITIPNSVTTIMQYAFDTCTGVTNATIGRGVTVLGISVFHACVSLENIAVDPLNTAYSSIDGVLFNKSQTMLVQCPLRKSGDYMIPGGVTATEQFAFLFCSGLTSVTIPTGFTTFGVSTFVGCSSLKKVFFEGNAPSYYIAPFDYISNVTVYYRLGTTGWKPVFANQPTAVWIEQPSYQQWAQMSGLLEKFPNASGETDDADQDGMTNLAEMQAGTDPTMATSALIFDRVTRLADLADADKTAVGSDQHALYFQSVPGKQYKIESATAFGVTWQTETAVTATTSQKRVLVTKPLDQRFYRVVLVP
jgi:hypothetical protein